MSLENGELLAEEILKILDKNPTPTSKETINDYHQIQNKIYLSIYNDFDKYNNSARLTQEFLKLSLTDTDLEIYKNNLITSAACIVTGNFYYHD